MTKGVLMDCYTYDGYLGTVKSLDQQILTKTYRSCEGNLLEIPYESKCEVTVTLNKESRLTDDNPEKILILSEFATIYTTPTFFGVNKDFNGCYKEVETTVFLKFYPRYLIANSQTEKRRLRELLNTFQVP